MRALVAVVLLPVLALGAGNGAAPNLMSVAGAGPAFALTFDAHAEAQGAAEMLALLRQRRLHVTIFFTGRFAERFPGIVAEASRDGHEIGNHTYSHPHLTTWAANNRHDTAAGVSRESLQLELRRTAEAIAGACGRPPALLWRAPYGEHNGTIRGWAAELGYLHVDWTRADGDALDALDWVERPGQRAYMNAEAMARRLLAFERKTGVPLAGSIVLMHLGSPRPDQPLLEALPIVLDETDRRGLRPVPVGDLLARGRSRTSSAPEPSAAPTP